MKKTLSPSRIVCGIVIFLFIAGCASGTKVTVTQDKYTPAFRSGDFSRLKGKKIILANFYNQAQNTKTYNYFSADKKVYYEASTSLESYFWYCFQKAFKYAGAHLVDYDASGYRGPRAYWWGVPPPRTTHTNGIPEFQLGLLSLTDQEFKFKAFIFKNGETKFEKEYTINMKAVATENIAELEKGSYRLVDLAFVTIMRDREFQKAF